MVEYVPVCETEEHHHTVTKEIASVLPSEHFFMDLAECFKVFGDPTRLKILLALDARELCVCDLADLLEMTKSAISHQLSSLRAARLVKYRREGKNVFYSLDDNHVHSIIACATQHLEEHK